VAFHPSGEWVAVGSAAGGLAVLAWPRLTESVEVQGHGDEVRGLVFARDGTLYTGSWDRTLAAWRLIAPEGEAEVADGGAVAGAVALRELRRFTFPSTLNDVSVDAKGARLGVAFSESKAQRTYEVYRREKRGEVEPSREWDVGAIVDATSGQVLRRGLGHHGVVASAAISPDGSSLVTGGWDRFVLLHGSAPRAARLEHGLAVRRVRFSRDGRFVIVAAWTPQVPTGNHQSSPAAQLVEVEYLEAKVED
jgi:WD40 repeat protein